MLLGIHRDSCRDPAAHLYAYATPTTTALRAILLAVKQAGLCGLIEVGAGTGYWAACLRWLAATEPGLAPLTTPSQKSNSHKHHRDGAEEEEEEEEGVIVAYDIAPPGAAASPPSSSSSTGHDRGSSGSNEYHAATPPHTSVLRGTAVCLSVCWS